MLTGGVEQKADPGQLCSTGLLRASSERPGRRAAKKCDELTPPHATPPDLRGCQSIRLSHASTKAFAAAQIAEARDDRLWVRLATIPVQAGFSGLLFPQQRTDLKHTRESTPHAVGKVAP